MSIRSELIISRDMEWTTVQSVFVKLGIKYPDLNADNTLVVNVSPDYSSTVAMHIAHNLSKDGEMADIMPIQVPYPDQEVDVFKVRASEDIDSYLNFYGGEYENYLLVEAGVIRGGNYTWLTKVFKEKLKGNIITLTLFENIGSVFKSDIVGSYYDDQTQDLTFYFERYNKHWR
jgi:hypothetical protein